MSSTTNTSPDVEDVLTSIRRLVRQEPTPQITPTSPPAHKAPRPEAAATERLVLTQQHRVIEPEDPYQPIRNVTAPPEVPTQAEAHEAVMAEDVDTLEDAPVFTPEAHITPFPKAAPQPDPEEVDVMMEASAPLDDQPEEVDLYIDVNAPQPESKEEAILEIEEDSFADSEILSPSKDEAEEAAVEGLLDEVQLREIIADVVREELSGALGERITRNVRKLVRREIRQVLASEKII